MYGLIGYPLGHSFSASFFNKKFADEGIPEHYELLPIETIGNLGALIKSLPDLKGFNVTIPYKQQIIPLLSEIDEEAAEIGAVNVVKLYADGTMKGFNTDAVGFRNSLSPLLKPHMKKALVLGTGGASKAVINVLKRLGLEVTKVSRNRGVDTLTYTDITPEIISAHHIIVNTTPLGMWPKVHEAPSLPYDALTPLHLCYDLVYNPEVTEFMKKSAEQGATIKNGLEMLHLQALAAWEIWTNKEK
ncbi:MAG: shikimate dehydrogenase [Bacteroides sp.]|nr:shikimate dehydrogenase [Bacteroides sp.]